MSTMQGIALLPESGAKLDHIAMNKRVIFHITSANSFPVLIRGHTLVDPAIASGAVAPQITTVLELAHLEARTVRSTEENILLPPGAVHADITTHRRNTSLA